MLLPGQGREYSRKGLCRLRRPRSSIASAPTRASGPGRILRKPLTSHSACPSTTRRMWATPPCRAAGWRAPSVWSRSSGSSRTVDGSRCSTPAKPTTPRPWRSCRASRWSWRDRSVILTWNCALSLKSGPPWCRRDASQRGRASRRGDGGLAGGEGGNFETVVFTSCNMIGSCSRCAEFERAVQWIRAADRFTRRYGCPFLYLYGRVHYGEILIATGDWPEAEAQLTSALSRRCSRSSVMGCRTPDRRAPLPQPQDRRTPCGLDPDQARRDQPRRGGPPRRERIRPKIGELTDARLSVAWDAGPCAATEHDPG